MKRSLFFIVSLFAFRAFAAGGPDGYGYTWIDSTSPNGPAFHFIEPAVDAIQLFNPVSQVAGTVTLAHPWSGIYGQKVSQLRVSLNGYITDLLTDDGFDNTNDAPLPQQPSSGGGNRIYAVHNFLAMDNLGRVTYEYHPVSPHPLHKCGVHVITWKNAYHFGSGDETRFDFQALLFDNFDILIQVSGNPDGGASSTTGIQNAAATTGLQVAANTPGSIPAQWSARILPPVLTVVAAGDSDNPAPAMDSIREVLKNAAPGTRIEVLPNNNALQLAAGAPATPGLGSRIPLNGVNVALDASAVANPLKIFGGDETRHFRLFNGAHLYLGNAFLLQGYGPNTDASGSVLVEGGSSLIADRVLWDGNRTELDGGALVVRNPGSQAILTHCTFRDNRAMGLGGAVSVRNGATLTGHYTRWMRNRAEAGGGGLFVQNASVSLTDCEFAQNETPANGGALRLFAGANVALMACTFDNNRAANGGGVAVENDPLLSLPSPVIEMTRCTFYENTAGDAGGALFESARNLSGELPSISFQYATLTRNQAGARGGGVAVTHGEPGFIGTCVAWNRRGNVFNNFNSNGSGSAVSANYSLESGSEMGFDLQNQDPKLSALGYFGGFVRTCHPLHGSPLIDGAVVPGTVPKRDARGIEGVRDGAGLGFYDIGAVEVGAEILVTTPGVTALQNAINTAPKGAVIRFDGVAEINAAELTLPSDGMILLEKTGTPLRLVNSRVFPEDGAAFAGINLEWVGGAHPLVSTNANGISLHIERCAVQGYNRHGTFHLFNVSHARVSLASTRFTDNRIERLFRGGDSVFWLEDVKIHANVFPEETTLAILFELAGSELWMRRSSVTDHRYDHGGAGGYFNVFYLNNSTDKTNSFACIEHSTLSGNEMQGDPFLLSNGLFVVRGSGYPGLFLRHNTIANNRLGGPGTFPILRSEFMEEFPRIRHEIQNNIFSSNRGTLFGGYESQGGNLFTDNPPEAHASDLVNTDARLYPLTLGANGTLHRPLRPGSPAIDAAPVLLVSRLDGRTGSRFRNGDGMGGAEPDIGAIESGRVLAVTTEADENDPELGQGTGNSLRECLAIATAQGGAANLDLSAVSNLQLLTTLSTAGLLLDLDALDNGVAISNGVPWIAGPNATLGLHGVRFTSPNGALLAQNNAVVTLGDSRVVGGQEFALKSAASARLWVRGSVLTENSGAQVVLAEDQSRFTLEDSTVLDNLATTFRAVNEASVALRRATLARNLSFADQGFDLRDQSRGLWNHVTFTDNRGNVRVVITARLLYLNSIFSNSPPLPHINGAGPAVTSVGGNLSEGNPAGFVTALGDQPFRTPHLSPLFIPFEGRPRVFPMAASPAFTRFAGAQPPPPVVTVTTLDDQEDTPAGEEVSLREAIRDAPNRAVITFAPDLNNGLIHLTLHNGEIELDRDVTLDATSLPNGISIRGRLLAEDLNLRVHGIHFTGHDSGATNGGAVHATGSHVMITHSAFSHNQSVDRGGAVWVDGGLLHVENAAFHANRAAVSGSLETNNASSLIRYSSFSGHKAPSQFALLRSGSGTMVFQANLVAGKNSISSASVATLQSLGHNAYDFLSSSTEPTDLFDANLDLAVTGFGHHGGWAPALGILDDPRIVENGPANGSGFLPPPLTDIRGYPRPVGSATDRGAVEFGASVLDSDGDGLPDWWELQHGFNPQVADDTTLDLDGDGASLREEFAFQTDPFDPDSTPVYEQEIIDGATPELQYTWSTQPGWPYFIEFTPDLLLAPWRPIARFNGTGDLRSESVPFVTSGPTGFWRLRLGLAEPFGFSDWSIRTVDIGGISPINVSMAYIDGGESAILFRDQTGNTLRFARSSGASWQFSAPVPVAGISSESGALAMDPTDGQPAFVYTDPGLGLRYAKWNGTAWDLQTIDANGSAGFLVFGPGSQASVVYRVSGVALGYAVFDGNAWQTQTVSPGPLFHSGFGLAFDLQGNPAISFLRNNVLHLTRWDGAFWQEETLEDQLTLQGPSSLQFEASGSPAVAFRESNDPDFAVWVARRVGTQWEKTLVDSGTNGTGASMRLIRNQDGSLQLAYSLYQGLPSLGAARFNGTDWETEVVDASLSGAHLGMALRNDGRVGIAYRRGNDAVALAERDPIAPTP